MAEPDGGIVENVSESPGGPKRSPVERIIETASELFYRNGIRTMGVDTIVEQAGVAKMTLYKHFGGKDELIAAYLRARDERWRVSLEEVTDRFEEPAERLLAVFEAYGQWLVSDGLRGCGFVNAAAELADPNHPAFAVAQQHKSGIGGHLATLAAEAGVKEPEELADQLLILLEGAAVMAMIRRSAEPLDTARSVAVRLVAAARA
jgi:AcrR family transcriptional regulator